MSETHDSTSLQSSVAWLVRSPFTTTFRALRELTLSYFNYQDINPKLIEIISGAKKSTTWLIESPTKILESTNDASFNSEEKKKAA